jgi:hypothetical protein
MTVFSWAALHWPMLLGQGFHSDPPEAEKGLAYRKILLRIRRRRVAGDAAGH